MKLCSNGGLNKMREKAKQMSVGEKFLGREKNKYKGSQARVFDELELVASTEANMNAMRGAGKQNLLDFFLFSNLTCQNNDSKSSLLGYLFLLQ